MPKRELIRKIEDKSAVIAIVGMGYVGLPLMLRFSEVGYRVIGIDIDASKVEQLNRGQSYIQHIRPEAIRVALANGFAATTDFGNRSALSRITLARGSAGTVSQSIRSASRGKRAPTACTPGSSN